jgi:hypothetical protein
MRNALLLVVVMAVVGLSGSSAVADEASDRPWSVGYAEADITPAPGQAQMSGYGSERYAKGTLSPLLAQVIVLRDADACTGILIAADIAGFERVMTEAIRRDIARKHGVAARNIILAASHTHWGPATQFHATYAAGGPNVWYMAFLEETILAAVDAALADLAPAGIEYGAIDLRGIACNRRLPRNGQIDWGPYAEGSTDPHTPILRMRRDRSPRQIVIVGHACHPTSSGSIEKWTPDYPGAMRDYLAGQLPDAKAVFVQGCGGDAKVVCKDPKTGELVFAADPNQSREAGEKLAKAALSHLETGPMTSIAASFASSVATGQLSYGQPWSREETEREAYTGSRKKYYTWVARQSLALPDASTSFRYDVQVWRLGGVLTLFAMEGEVCSPWGPALRAMAGTDRAMVLGYANNVTAYIPDQRIVREGGYEGGEAQKFFLPGPFTENIDAEIKQIVAAALSGLK